MLKQVIICITAVLLFHPPPFEMQGLCAELPKIPITCNAGAYLVGTTASVICNFNTDMNTDKRPISVVRYRKSTFLDDPGQDVLLCQWEDNGQSYECELDKGFSIDGNITDHLRLQLPADTENFTGLYSCFIMLAPETLPNACEVTVKEERGVWTTPATYDTDVPQEQGESILLWLIVLPGVLIGVLGVAIVYKYRRPSLRNETNDELSSEEDILMQADTSCPKEILKGFEMNNEACQEVMSLLQREIEANVGKDASATIKMFSTLVKDLPRGEENGQFMVVNLGSRSLRILFVRIEGPQIETHDSKTYTIPPDVRLGTCVQLLNFLENRLSMFVTSKQLTNKETSVGVVFSFPCKYAEEGDLTTARPKKWTKGFNCDKVVGKDFGKLLHEKLKNKLTTCKLTIKVIINDAAGLLIAGIHKDKACRISFVIGKGVNGCYMKDNGSDGTVQGHGDENTIIATEWGALGENECLEKFRTDFDRTAVNFSMSPKEQILEKMVGRLYIGEIVRQVLLLLTKEGHLFKPFYSELPALNEKRGFTTENVLIIDSDMDQEYLTTRDLLQHLEFDNISDEDCKLVQFVCRIVLQRAAFFAAAALATLVKHVQQSHVTVAIDGSLWRSHLRFKQQMMAKTKELVGPDFDVTFLSIIDGSEIGAALTTAL